MTQLTNRVLECSSFTYTVTTGKQRAGDPYFKLQTGTRVLTQHVHTLTPHSLTSHFFFGTRHPRLVCPVRPQLRQCSLLGHLFIQWPVPLHKVHLGTTWQSVRRWPLLPQLSQMTGHWFFLCPKALQMGHAVQFLEA